MTISIGCDHAGFPYKDSIIRLLKKQGIEVLDFGTNSPQLPRLCAPNGLGG
jgi:ribose 5-phosphate isomerase B